MKYQMQLIHEDWKRERERCYYDLLVVLNDFRLGVVTVEAFRILYELSLEKAPFASTHALVSVAAIHPRLAALLRRWGIALQIPN